MPIEQDLAARGGKRAADHVEECRLACTVGADQRMNPAGGNFARDIVEGEITAKPLADACDLKQHALSPPADCRDQPIRTPDRDQHKQRADERHSPVLDETQQFRQ